MLESLRAAKKAGVALKGLNSCGTSRGLAWFASVYLDGSKVGTIEDLGNGGPMEVGIAADVQEVAVRNLKDAGLVLTLNGEAYGDDYNTRDWLEAALAAIADDMDTLKRFQRKLKTQTFFRTTDCPPGEFRVIKKPFDESIRKAMVAKYGDKLLSFLHEDIADL
ncbi:hypothetical protein [Geopseudomonas aromaticivorans]